tara:strand:- start:6934 stop:7293 length:360 start_codon:yes stop_codon:yes gene_type:complete
VGGRPLAVASEAGSVELVLLLLDGGVDPNLRDVMRLKVLRLRGGHHEIAKMLLNEGADPNRWIESSGTPMHQANYDRMKGLLYQYGGNLKDAADFVSDDNIDALVAFARRDPEVVGKNG